jgi:hypothetical protein
LFGIYIDELETFLHEHIQDNDGFLLHQVLISILLFVDDMVLLASSPEGTQRQLDALALFCDLQQLMVDLGKTKVMIFNKLKKTSNFISSSEGRRLRSPTPTHTWGCNSQDPTSVCDQPSKLISTRATNPYPFSRDNASDTIFRTSHPRCPSWNPLSDTLFSMAQRFGGILRIGPRVGVEVT